MATKKEAVSEAVVNEAVEAAVETEATAEASVTTTEVATTEAPASSFGMGGFDLSELGLSEEDLKGLTGLENIDSSEISIPYATLISKATTGFTIGDIVFPDGTVIKGADGQMAKSISVLNIQPVRVYFPQPFNPKNSYVCRSLDGIVGAPDGQYAGQSCDTCEFAKYPEGGGSSPCRDQRLLLCSQEDGSLFHIQVGGVGVGIWKKFMSAQVFHMLPKAHNILGALNIDLYVKTVDTDYGPFPALDFRINKEKPFHAMERIKSSLTALKSYKEFAAQHAASAAAQAKVQMAAGEADSEGTGKNNNLF